MPASQRIDDHPPPVSADTEFADMRAAYDALDAAMKARLEELRVLYSTVRN